MLRTNRQERKIRKLITAIFFIVFVAKPEALALENNQSAEEQFAKLAKSSATIDIQLDDEFIFLVDVDDYINVFSHDYLSIAQLSFPNRDIIQIAAKDNRFLVLSRIADPNLQELWMARHILELCDWTGNCEEIRAGKFGISAFTQFQSKIVTSEFEWGDFYSGEGQSPTNSRLIEIEDGIAKQIHFPHRIGIWDLDAHGDQLYLLINWPPNPKQEEKSLAGIWVYEQEPSFELKFRKLEGYEPYAALPAQSVQGTCSQFRTDGITLFCIDVYVKSGRSAKRHYSLRFGPIDGYRRSKSSIKSLSTFLVDGNQITFIDENGKLSTVGD